MFGKQRSWSPLGPLEMGLVDGNMGRAPGLCSLGHRDPIPSIKKSTTLILLLKKKETTLVLKKKKKKKKSTMLHLEAAAAFHLSKNAVAAAESSCSEQPKNL